jgi:hypothetical protein
MLRVISPYIYVCFVCSENDFSRLALIYIQERVPEYIPAWLLSDDIFCGLVQFRPMILHFFLMILSSSVQIEIQNP